MAKEIQLKVEKREITGRKVKNLRKQGILPANIYGHKIKSLAIQLPVDDFVKVFQEAGETELIYLLLEGEKEKRPALIRNMHIHPVTHKVLHADFIQVDLTEETTASVPITFIGESPAVKEDKGLLLELMTELEVTCLPTDIPSEIEIDISNLTEVDDAIAVKDLKLSKKVKFEADPEELICKIEAVKAEEEITEEAEDLEVAEGEEVPSEAEESAKVEKPKGETEETE